MNTDDKDTPPEAIDESADPTVADDLLTADGSDRPDFEDPIVGFGPTDEGLVRDPTTTLGGVLSGIAHHYGWDVAVTRLVAVVLVLATSGVGLIVYLLAWVIVPRAKFWPPPGPSKQTRLSGRDVGVGLVAAGALLALAIGGGDFGVVLIPLALVGGGIWLLLQNPSAEAEESAPVGPTTDDFRYSTHTPPPPGEPVPPRSRRRRFAIFAMIGAAFLALLAIVAIPAALFLALGSADFEFSSDDPIEIRPVTVGDFPLTIIEDNGAVILDLSALDVADFEGIDTPVAVRLDIDFGSIEVMVPADLVVSVDADVDIGSVQVFGGDLGGFRSSLNIVENDPHLELDLDVNLGDIVVVRER